MSEVKVVALITATPEHRTAVEQALRAMVAPSRAEAGCLQYDLHQEVDHPDAYVFIERWASAQALQEHTETNHFRAFLAELEGKLVSLEVKKVTPL
ncbi:putative quinol monooxygenase [Serratia sp. DD3]|uniref:putative quinol monooxygenase n=1 Tax=Serratia sp. DD3 TaxID=1410619 RepID=UPI0003C527CA|nr:putative quinol monooxygenase [Serratia sp. DD3]KEY59261.1 putative monooxygenase [Serratia sp. DD3]